MSSLNRLVEVYLQIELTNSAATSGHVNYVSHRSGTIAGGTSKLARRGFDRDGRRQQRGFTNTKQHGGHKQLNIKNRYENFQKKEGYCKHCGGMTGSPWSWLRMQFRSMCEHGLFLFVTVKD
ncbi:hypothetical protein HHI36_008107 [Cryptolaemus montrouzieri]|uniref:Uncharacterized protein n=1 Tax=Cryptolaemus montrouzieri TaxID=559131 RepID=A0ABD2MRN4_9CUCU